MLQPTVSASSRLRRISPHLRGHLLLFDDNSSRTCDSSTSIRLLLVFVVLEGVLGPRLLILRWFQIPSPPSWIRVPALLALALLLIRFVAQIRFSQVGLTRWRDWTRTEKSYFLQALFLGNAVFLLISARRVHAIAANHALWGPACVVVITQLAWGLYQELVYRGILQTALVSRWGAIPGILASNALFTFGPLHFYHFSSVSPVPTFVAIFVTGLLIGLLFWRSGNLWIVGILHGVGDAYIDGLASLVH